MKKTGASPDNSTGFTLLELMTVIAVIGLLVILGVPAYKDYGHRARRADATNSLLALQAEQEKFRSTCVSYAVTLAGTRTCNSSGPAYILGRANSDSTEGYYTLTIVSANASTYLATAAPKAGGLQIGDSCATFAINQDGPDHTGTYASAKCWGR